MHDATSPLPVLQGERCLLRALVPEDAPALVAHADNPAVARKLFDGFPQPYDLAAATAWASHEANSGAFGRVWAIVVDGGLIGCIGLKQERGWLRCNAEIGYWIGEPFWRRGIASDAVRQVTHIADADAQGRLIGTPLLQPGVINYPKRALGLCGGMTGARFVTTTEVYPDSPSATPAECNAAQGVTVTAAIAYLLQS